MSNGENSKNFKFSSLQRRAKNIISDISEISDSGLSKFSELSIRNILKRFFFLRCFLRKTFLLTSNSNFKFLKIY
jgi:hypothetical protein